VLALCCISCGAADQAENPSRLAAAASIPPHAWLVARVAGDSVEIHTLLGPGESPATHQPSDLQVSGILASDVFFSAGVPFETGAWFDALDGMLEIVPLGEGVATRIMAGHSHGDGHTDHSAAELDPHAWLSPKRLAAQATTVAATLSRLDPDRADTYTANLEALVAELAELDAWIRSTLDPHRGRSFMVFHPSWGYFADDFGLVQIAIETEGKQPSDAELTRLTSSAETSMITVVYVQPQIAGQSARALAGAIGVRVETLDPLVPDVPANLRAVTETLVRGFGG
jgi:zinc transport system substrate-binding protein